MDNGLPLLDFFFTMLMFFLFFIWIWLLISVFADIFRSNDIGGVAKAAWIIFVIIVPFLGVLIYLIVRGRSMQERAMEAAQEQAKAQQEYIQSVAGTKEGTADQIAKLASLRDSGVLTEAEFQAQKEKLLA